MNDYSRDPRLLPGSAAPSGPAVAPPERVGEISFGQLFGVLRRRYRLVLLMAVLGAAIGAFLAMREPATYQARAVLRVADERAALTGGMEEPTPQAARTTDPILSLVQLVQSRSVLGAVVDSLGLQVRPITPDFRRTLLAQVMVDRRMGGDSITLAFAPNHVTAQDRTRRASAAYGQVLSFGMVRFAVTRRPKVASAVVEVVPREMAISDLAGNLAVTARLNTDLIDVAYTSESPRMAQEVANRMVEYFRTLNIEAARQTAHRRRIVLEEQLAQTDSALARAQGELAAFRSRLQLGSSENKLEAEQSAMLALETRRSALEADRGIYAGLVKQLQSSDEATRESALRALASSPALGENVNVNDLYQRLMTYRSNLDSLTSGPWAAAATNPQVVALQRKIQTAEQQLAQAVNVHLSTLDTQIQSLGALHHESSQSIQVLPAAAAEELRLTSRVQTLEALGGQQRQDYLRARTAEEVEAGDVTIVDLADVPYLPLAGTTAIKFGLGLILGVVLGGFLAFLLEALNTSIRRPEDIESLLHLPGLAVIPRLDPGAVARPRAGRLAKGAAAHALPRTSGGTRTAAVGTVTQPFSVGTEAFRMLRTSLIWSDDTERLRTLVVTSAAPGEGKTLTAANLAVSFAHDGLEVLLVDCDVRRPRLHGLFRVPRSPGLLDLLLPPNGNGNGNGTVGSLSLGIDGHDPEALQNVLRPTPIRGLTLLTCGTLPTNASDLLSGIRMRTLLGQLKQRFGLVILDTPPVLATADAGILGSLADGVLLVVRAGQTDRLAAQRAAQQLTNVGSRVVGAVLNDPKGELSQYGEYYYPYEYVPER